MTLKPKHLRHHLANLTATLKDHPPITDAALVTIEDQFLQWIKPLALKAPYGHIWPLDTGILSHDNHNNEYCYFRYQGTPWPNWLKIKDRLNPHHTQHLTHLTHNTKPHQPPNLKKHIQTGIHQASKRTQ